MRCLKCGMPFDEDLNACPHCGAAPKAKDKDEADEVQILNQRPQLEDDTIIPASSADAQIGESLPIPGRGDSASAASRPSHPSIPAPENVDLDHDVPDDLLRPEDPNPLHAAAAKFKSNVMLIAGLSLALLFINHHTHVFDDLLGRSKPAKTETETPPVPPPPMPTPANPATDAVPRQGSPVPETEPPPAAPKPPVQTPEPVVVAWRFEGQVYDMVTLRPIKGAQLVFMGGDQDYNFSTDKQGLYKVKVPPLEGASYQVLVDHAEYLEGYFDEADPPYHQRPRAARIGMRNAKPRNKPWEGGAAITQRDLVLFPEVSY
ncbi:MAG: hypothetical protein WC728_09510 [Elusimicrobiota bacterium]